MPDLTSEQTQKIREMVHERRMVEAIKTYRIFTGVGLKEAKDVIDVMFHNDPLGAPPPVPQTTTNDPMLDKNIRDLLLKRKKMEAVKLYRQEKRIGLKEAKDIVDGIEASMRREYSTANNDPFADDPANKRMWLFVVVILLLLALGAAAVFLSSRGV